MTTPIIVGKQQKVVQTIPEPETHVPSSIQELHIREQSSQLQSATHNQYFCVDIT